MTNLSVVIPIKDERENLRPLHSRLHQVLDPLGLAYEIIVVDDGSTDGSFGVLQELAAADPAFRVVRLRRNFGQTAALQAGIDWSSGEVLVTMDGDLQNDPADIPKLVGEVSRGADLVCGYRAQRRDTRVKRLTSRIANAVRSRYTKDGVRDTGCTLKAMRRECVGALFPFKGMHRFIPALIKDAGYRLVEIPVNHRPRRFGQTKYGLGNRAVRATVDMFGVRWLLSRRLNYKIREQD